MEIDAVRILVRHGALRWTNHIMVRLLQRQISHTDIEYALLHGEIIEQYPKDYPYPSCLVFGLCIRNEPLHVVCGMGEDELWLITAYRPNENEWLEDMKTRRREST